MLPTIKVILGALLLRVLRHHVFLLIRISVFMLIYLPEVLPVYQPYLVLSYKF